MIFCYCQAICTLQPAVLNICVEFGQNGLFSLIQQKQCVCWPYCNIGDALNVCHRAEV